MNEWHVLYPNVVIDESAILEPFVIIGKPPRGRSPGELATRIGAGAVIRSHTVVYAGNIVGDRFQAGHGVLVREENQIGNDVSIGSHTVVEHHVTIEDGVRIHSNAFIPEYTVLKMGCWIGPGAIFTNAKYPRSRGVKERLQGPVIGEGAKIGAGAVILPGITVGANALVGAGAVVVSDVPEGAVVVGNPASVVKKVTDIEPYRACRKGGESE